MLSGRAAIQELLAVEDYVSALERISESKKLYHEELSGITCMRQVGEQLDEYDNLVGEIMCNKFVSIAIQWEEDVSSLSASLNMDAGFEGKISIGMIFQMFLA